MSRADSISSHPQEPLSCKLTTPELAKRKQTVIADLKGNVLESTETAEGFRYKFLATDERLDELLLFIKTERQCCEFFSFSLSVEKEFAWLGLSGTNGIKEFIKTELAL